MQTYSNVQGTGRVPELVLLKDNGDINSEAKDGLKDNGDINSEAKDGLLNGTINTCINQIGTATINNNKPGNLKQYNKCDSCDFAVIQKGILTDHMTVCTVRLKNFLATSADLRQ